MSIWEDGKCSFFRSQCRRCLSKNVRYKEMDLTPEEVEQLEGLKPEYIARVASELVE